jgi:hypothetical protein
MSKLAQAAVLAVILSMPLAARGHGYGLVQSPVTVGYYYPGPVEYVPVTAYLVSPVCVPPPLVYPTAPAVSGPNRIYAPPTPAPPSAGPATSEFPSALPSTPAKPSATPPSGSPGFGESTSFYDSYSVASAKMDRPAGERCTVDFWNLTDRDLLLRIDGGPAQVLPRGKTLAVSVPRQFTWEVQGRQSQPARIDLGESALQIVIRR